MFLVLAILTIATAVAAYLAADLGIDALSRWVLARQRRARLLSRPRNDHLANVTEYRGPRYTIHGREIR